MSFASLVADKEWDAIHRLLDEGSIHGVDPDVFDNVLASGPVSLIRRLAAVQPSLIDSLGQHSLDDAEEIDPVLYVVCES
jgi:hypothetical protein